MDLKLPYVRDYALADAVDEWLHHPAIGDPSWDAFEREPRNPIYVGLPPYEWPVNGTLFRDPVSGRWYAFVSIYPRGYFTDVPFDIRILREDSDGRWTDLGLVFGDKPPTYPGVGKGVAATDGHVVYHGGLYHMLFGWADRENMRGGLGYAWSECPDGPYHCTAVPVDDDLGRAPILGRYVRAYAGTLIPRKRDWLILHMMSTPGNAGGTWGLFARTASRPEGPYSEPKPILFPQSNVFHPPVIEFFPAYVANGRLYAPATSVAANRNFQVLFSAPLEKATEPSAWRLERLGSLWHQEPVPWESMGIWGQTFAAVQEPNGDLRVLYPCKTAEDIGTISIARRDRRAALRNGFVLAAPNAPSFGILRHAFREFELEVEVAASGDWSIAWACRGPVGPNHHLAGSAPHDAMYRDRVEWRLGGQRWQVVHTNERGAEAVLGDGPLHATRTDETRRFVVRQGTETLQLMLEQNEVLRTRMPAKLGRIELLAHRGAHIRVHRFRVAGRPVECPELWLWQEGLAGAASPEGAWVEDPLQRWPWGAGMRSAASGARLKFNFVGRRCELIAPSGPRYGHALIWFDGRRQKDVSFRADVEQSPSSVFATDVPRGPHALVVENLSGTVPAACLKIWP